MQTLSAMILVFWLPYVVCFEKLLVAGFLMSLGFKTCSWLPYNVACVGKLLLIHVAWV